jgi:NAD+ diphosphatase
VAGRAKQVVAWHATHHFCGRCGGETERVAGEMAMRCTRCGMMHFPRVSPAVIVRSAAATRCSWPARPAFPRGLHSVSRASSSRGVHRGDGAARGARGGRDRGR